jgi:hypothetical protein
MPSVGWALFYMFVVLKIPIALMLWIVWWAVREEPAADETDVDGTGGGGDHPRPRKPRPPRRGPHADPLPKPPARVRAQGKTLDRQHR